MTKSILVVIMFFFVGSLSASGEPKREITLKNFLVQNQTATPTRVVLPFMDLVPADPFIKTVYAAVGLEVGRGEGEVSFYTQNDILIGEIGAGSDKLGKELVDKVNMTCSDKAPLLKVKLYRYRYARW